MEILMYDITDSINKKNIHGSNASTSKYIATVFAVALVWWIT